MIELLYGSGLRATELVALPRSAIVVLGGGREARAPEYGRGMLSPVGLHRLAYGLWLAVSLARRPAEPAAAPEPAPDAQAPAT